MVQKPLRGFRKPVEEVVYGLADLVVELVCDGRIEEAEKQPAVITPGVPVMHQREGPGAAKPRISRRLSAQSWKRVPTLTYLVPWVIWATRGVQVSIKGVNEASERHWLTLSEYMAERRSSRSATISGSLNTTICEPMTLRCKIFVSEILRGQTIHKP